VVHILEILGRFLIMLNLPHSKNDAVAAGKAGWLKHLFDDGCTGNPRNSGWRASATAVVTKKTEGGGKKKK
jgi:hypothetical protein